MRQWHASTEYVGYLVRGIHVSSSELAASADAQTVYGRLFNQ